MGRVLLVVRLVLADVRRHKAHAAMLVLAVTAAVATLALGLSLNGACEALYRQTRAATGGPDVVALAPDSGPDATRELESLATHPEVVGHNGPYAVVYSDLAVHGRSSGVVVHGASLTPGPINRPLVTSGEWIRPGGAVVERGLATALGVKVGDRVTVSDRRYPVVGIAVTAATSIYPWAAGIGPLGGPSDPSGLVWMTAKDASALAGRDLTVTTAMDLKLRDPSATNAFRSSLRSPTTRLTLHSWQFIATQDTVILSGTEPILVVGGWLLGFLAITGVAALAAGRIVEQTRRAGLLKAIGATPGLIAAVLLTEFLALAVLAQVLGLAVARLVEPAIANPTASLIGCVVGPDGTTLVATTLLVLAVALLTMLPPTVRALRTATVSALTSPAQYLRHRPLLTTLSAVLPTSLLVGLRLTARRPGRAVLHAFSTAATVTGITGLLIGIAQPVRPYAALPNIRDEQNYRLLLAVTVMLVALAIVNTIAITWMTAMESRVSMAVTRALGATPGQVSAGLSFAQLLPAVPGAVAGVYLGIFLFGIFSVGQIAMPPASWLLAAVLATLFATAALTALPARFAARHPVARTLSAETV